MMSQRTRDLMLFVALALCLTGVNLFIRSLAPHAPDLVPEQMFSTSTPNASIGVLVLGLAILLVARKGARQGQGQRYPQRRPSDWL